VFYLGLVVFDMTEEKSSHGKDDDKLKSITSKKFNGINYLVCPHAVKIFMEGKRMEKYFTENPK
jgi:hypothetical protein